MKTNIGICVKDKNVQVFLESFFRGSKAYSLTRYDDARSMKESIGAGNPDILVVESPGCLRWRSHNGNAVRTLCLVAGDIDKGLEGLMKSGIEHYVLPPFDKRDFAYKLRLVEEKSKILDNIRQEKDDLEAIADLMRLVTSTLDPKEVLYLIVKKISELIPVTRCSIIGSDIADEKKIIVFSSFENPSINELHLDLSKYPEIKEAIRTRKAIVVEDAMKDPLMKNVNHAIKPLGIRSIVVVPIIFQSEVIGTLFLRTSSRGFKFTKNEIKLCEAIASASSNALHNAFLYQEVKREREHLQKLAITDYLTDIYNIRYLYHRLEAEFNRSKRYNIPLSCIMMDIDHFKAVNDSLGHAVGDMVLKEFAGLIKAKTRMSDVFARYGGEEFVMLLTETPLDGALKKARMLHNLVRSHKFHGLDGKVSITVSLGVSHIPHENIQTHEDLIRFADTAMLKAKVGGRDRIEIAV